MVWFMQRDTLSAYGRIVSNRWCCGSGDRASPRTHVLESQDTDHFMSENRHGYDGVRMWLPAPPPLTPEFNLQHGYFRRWSCTVNGKTCSLTSLIDRRFSRLKLRRFVSGAKRARSSTSPLYYLCCGRLTSSPSKFHCGFGEKKASVKIFPCSGYYILIGSGFKI